MKREWYELENVNAVDSPALIVFPERVKVNIAKAIALTGSPNRLRPHVKTHKSAEVTQFCLEAGITKFKCATIAEAEMLAQLQTPDVLISYQLTGPKLRRYVQLINSYPKTTFSSLIDNEESLDELISLSKKESIKFNLFIDLDVGMHRTGIGPGPGATQLVKNAISNGLELKGFQMYDGHIRDADLELRTEKSNICFQNVMNWISLQNIGHYELICGGSPTFTIHANRKEVICSPGTFVYWDYGYHSIPHTGDFLPAAVLISRIISKPSNLICVDLGHKSVAAENNIDKRVYFLNAAGLKPIGQSEEHLVLEPAGNHSFKIGDVLYGLPYHICPTVALYDKVYTAEDHEIKSEWKNIARTRKINI